MSQTNAQPLTLQQVGTINRLQERLGGVRRRRKAEEQRHKDAMADISRDEQAARGECWHPFRTQHERYDANESAPPDTCDVCGAELAGAE